MISLSLFDGLAIDSGSYTQVGTCKLNVHNRSKNYQAKEALSLFMDGTASYNGMLPSLPRPTERMSYAAHWAVEFEAT